jgi:hypothetical protein
MNKVILNYVQYLSSALKPFKLGVNLASVLGKTFHWPKKEWNSVRFSSFSLYDANCPFLPKLLPALFLKKPWYPCPFEILAEALWTGIRTQSWFGCLSNAPPILRPGSYRDSDRFSARFTPFSRDTLIGGGQEWKVSSAPDCTWSFARVISRSVKGLVLCKLRLNCYHFIFHQHLWNLPCRLGRFGDEMSPTIAAKSPSCLFSWAFQWPQPICTLAPLVRKKWLSAPSVVFR